MLKNLGTTSNNPTNGRINRTKVTISVQRKYFLVFSTKRQISSSFLSCISIFFKISPSILFHSTKKPPKWRLIAGIRPQTKFNLLTGYGDLFSLILPYFVNGRLEINLTNSGCCTINLYFRSLISISRSTASDLILSGPTKISFVSCARFFA